MTWWRSSIDCHGQPCLQYTPCLYLYSLAPVNIWLNPFTASIVAHWYNNFKGFILTHTKVICVTSPYLSYLLLELMSAFHVMFCIHTGRKSALRLMHWTLPYLYITDQLEQWLHNNYLMCNQFACCMASCNIAFIITELLHQWLTQKKAHNCFLSLCPVSAWCDLVMKDGYTKHSHWFDNHLHPWMDIVLHFMCTFSDDSNFIVLCLIQMVINGPNCLCLCVCAAGVSLIFDMVMTQLHCCTTSFLIWSRLRSIDQVSTMATCHAPSRSFPAVVTPSTLLHNNRVGRCRRLPKS